MRVVRHVVRAAVIFWVAAILLPSAVQRLEPSTGQGPSARSALHGLSGTAGSTLTGVRDRVDDVQRAEEGVLRFVARAKLETERFIAGIP